MKIIVETQKHFETAENIFDCLLGVVPGEAIVEEVVKQRHAGLVAEAVLLEDAVWLCFVDGASGGPAVANGWGTIRNRLKMIFYII